MSYVSTAEPIKIGYLMDFLLPPWMTRRSRGTTSPSCSSWCSTRGSSRRSSTGRSRSCIGRSRASRKEASRR